MGVKMGWIQIKMCHPLARNEAVLAPFRANGAHPSYTTPISCSITTPSYIMRMLARKNSFSPHPYLHHWIELLQSWIKLYSYDISFSIRRIPALLSSSKARGVVWMSCNTVKRSRKILGHGQVVKVQNWPVKNLDPGRGWIHCVYGSIDKREKGLET